jgi:hypothetical protein
MHYKFVTLFAATNAALCLALPFLSGDLLSFYVHFIIYVNVLLPGLSAKACRPSVDYLDPLFVSLTLYTLYAWCPPLNDILHETTSYDAIREKYYLAVILGAAGLSGGYFMVQRSQWIKRVIAKRTRWHRRVDNGRFLFILCGLAIVALAASYDRVITHYDPSDIRPYTATAAQSRVDRTDSSGTFEYIEQTAIQLLTGACLVLAFRKSRKQLQMIWLAPLAVLSLFSAVQGSKAALFNLLSTSLIYYNYRMKRIRFVPIVIGAAVALSGASLFNHVRTTTDPAEMVRLAEDFVHDRPELVLPWNSGEFTKPGIALENIISATTVNEMGFSYGRTWLTGLLCFIPRVVYPGRPPTAAELHMQTFYPDLASHGVNFALFMPADGYWAFGMLGVGILMTLYGALARIMYQYLLQNLQGTVGLLVYCCVFQFMCGAAMRNDLFTTVKVSIMVAAPVLVTALLATKAGSFGVPRVFNSGCATVPSRFRATASGTHQ